MAGPPSQEDDARRMRRHKKKNEGDECCREVGRGAVRLLEQAKLKDGEPIVMMFITWRETPQYVCGGRYRGFDLPLSSTPFLRWNFLL